MQHAGDRRGSGGGRNVTDLRQNLLRSKHKTGSNCGKVVLPLKSRDSPHPRYMQDRPSQNADAESSLLNRISQVPYLNNTATNIKCNVSLDSLPDRPVSALCIMRPVVRVGPAAIRGSQSYCRPHEVRNVFSACNTIDYVL
jgi:hypothetical protein